MKCSFFQAAVVSILLYGYTRWTLTKRMEKKLDKNSGSNIEQILVAKPNNFVQPPTTHLENYQT